MDDVIMLKSGFAKMIISMLLNRAIKKYGLTGTTIDLDGFRMEHGEDGKIRISTKVTIESSEHDVYKIVKNQ